MFHVSIPPNRRNRTGTAKWLAIMGLSLLCTGLLTGVAFCRDGGNEIVAVKSKATGSSLEIRITGTSEPTFTAYELFSPSRVVIDIAEAMLKADFTPQLPQSSGITLKSTPISDITPPLLRMEFTPTQAMDFSSTQQGNDIILTFSRGAADSPADQGTVISDVKVTTGPAKTVVRLEAGKKITDYTYDILPKDGTNPDRLYIDVNNTSGDALLKERQVGTALGAIRVAKRGSGLRFVLDSSLNDIFAFAIQPVAEGLEVTITEPRQDDQVGSIIKEKSSLADRLPTVKPLEKQQPAAKSTEQKMVDAFNFAGYNKQRITVDFYKIDLHNVFRLFREVSGLNIVVDQGVGGSLTLALDDVPWDFALDIILNLKGLQKEERFNTLVITKQGKSMNWPKKTESNISFEADAEVAKKEALVIKKQATQESGVIEAKRLIAKARKLERREDFEHAVTTYEQALAKWPKNSKLANKIASLYLVQLRQNAKAVYYADKALKADKNNDAAALNAAIALASMQENKRAVEYFDQSISKNPPSREALLSYAVFSEEQKEYRSALKLLAKHDQMYGKDLNSMVATARIYDKQGDSATATQKYEAILYSGFRIPPDLTKYIQGRIALKQAM